MSSGTTANPSLSAKPHTARILCPLACGLVAVVCYANSLGNGFCEDDYAIILRNPLVMEPGQWERLWITDYWHEFATEMPYHDLLYRPVAILSYRLNRVMGGTHPAGYHLVNVLLHAAVSMLVYRFAARMTGSRACAVVAGVVFAVLPIHTEAVNNTVGRAELLAALFVLLALWLFEPEESINPVRTALRQGLGAVAVFGALASKETGVAVIALVPLFNWAWRGAALPRPNKPTKRRRVFTLRSIGTAVAIAFAVTVYGILRYVALGGRLYQPVTLTKSINVMVDASLWERICGGLQLWGMYWAKTLWPRVLVLNYSINEVTLADSLLEPHVLLGVAITGASVLVAIAAWRHGHREPAVWLVALAVSYVPISNTLVLIKTFFAERLWYLPSVWATVLIAWCLCVGLPRLLFTSERRHRVALRGGVALAAILSVAAIGRCWARNVEWHDNGTVYAAAYRDHPQAIGVLVNYGNWLAWNGRPAEGVRLLRQAVLIDVGFTHAHRHLGEILLERGEVQEALQHLSTAESQIPGHPPTLARLEQARTAMAAHARNKVTELEQQVAEQPDSLDALIALVDKLTELGQLNEAADRLLRAESRFSNDSRYWHRTAVALVLAGRRDNGIQCYDRVIRLAPNDATLQIELAMLLLDRNAEGDRAKARALSDRAAQLDPNNVQVQMGRAEVLALDGQRSEAARIYRHLAGSLQEGSELQQRCRIRAEFLEK